MRRRGDLSRKERREFEDLVRVFFEYEAADPQAPGDSSTGQQHRSED